MTKQEQIEAIDEIIRSKFNDDVAYRFSIDYGDYLPVYIDEIAEALYNAGYRKTFTRDLASDTQKAFKEGYKKGYDEQKAEIERLKKEVDYWESETKVARKDIDEAVKETTEKILRSVAKDYLYCIDDIRELCKEFNVNYRDIFKSIPELVKYI